MNIVCILLLIFRTNILTTSTTEISFYNYLEDDINALIPHYDLTQDDINDLKAQVILWKETNEIILQPMDFTIDLIYQFTLLEDYIRQNTSMAIRVVDNTELSNLYLDVNYKNFELKTKIQELIQQVNLQNKNNNTQSSNENDSYYDL